MQRSGAREQVEGLKNEADFLVADARQLVIRHVADQVAVDVVLPAGRRIEAADQVHQGRFARPRRAHDRDVLAALDLDIHSGHGVNLGIAHDIGLPEIVGADDDAVPLQLFALLEEFLFRLLCNRHRMVSRFSAVPFNLRLLRTLVIHFDLRFVLMVRITWYVPVMI